MIVCRAQTTCAVSVTHHLYILAPFDPTPSSPMHSSPIALLSWEYVQSESESRGRAGTCLRLHPAISAVSETDTERSAPSF